KAYEKRDTSTFWKHLRSKHLDKINDILEEISELLEFSEEIFKKKLLNWIVTDDQAFISIENPAFQEILKYLRSNIKISSAAIIRKELDKNFDKTKKEIKQELKLLAITCDNASNMDKMLQYISSNKNINFNIKNQHIRCFAHIINLAARDLIKELYFKIEFYNDNDILKDKDIEKLNNIIFR
ncbi:25595_t:CDS:2, partial [Dentiscutata erythropus]